MNEFFGWIKWSISRLETWQYWFIFAMLINLCGVFASKPYDMYMNIVSMLIILSFFIKWFVWDSLVKSWNKYKQHRNELFTTIKESEQ